MKNFIAGDDGDQNYGDHSGSDDRNDDDNTLIATKQVKNFMDGAGIKEIWTSGRLCDAEVFRFPENISILVWKLQKILNYKKIR